MGAVLAALALLSDNPKGQTFPADDLRRIRTDCTFSWVTNGSYATSSYMIRTGTDQAGKSRLLNGAHFGGGVSSAWGGWGEKANAGFTIDLKEPYLVAKAVLWSAERKPYQGISGYSVLLSIDGTNFVTAARREVAADFSGGFREIHPVAIECVLERPALARFVRLLVDKNPARTQMVLGEVAVFGDLPPQGMDVKAFSPENRRPIVPLTVDGFSSGAAAFAWDGFAAARDVREWRLYAGDRPFDDTRAEGVKLLATLPAKTTSHVVFPLVPAVTNHYAVAAVYADGEGRHVKSLAHAPLGPLEVRRFRDMLGMNYYWGGGGANSKTKAWYDVAADFLAASPFRRTRWWMAPEWALKEYMARRIEVCNWTGEIENAKRYGLYLHDMGNEPELNPNDSPEGNVARYRRVRETWRQAGCGAEHKFFGPVVGATGRGFEFFRKWIAAGGAEIVDAYDFHTYCGNSADFEYPDGYPPGSPEAIIPAVARIRDFLREKGIEKPLTCSEWGYSDTKTANSHMAYPTPLKKAQYLVRGSIIHHALDFRRLFIYSFYDEGYDPDYSEHTFGILSRDLQKKPAYHALETMGRVLGDARVEGPAKGLGTGDFGYVFGNVDRPGYVTVFWNGAREKSGVFRTTPGEIEIISLFGERRTVKTRPDGTFLARFGGSAVYFAGCGRVDMVSSSAAPDRTDAGRARIEVSAAADCAVFGTGERPSVSYWVKNGLAARVDVMLTLKNLKGETLAERKAGLPAGGAETFAFPADLKGSALDKFTLTVDYEADGESFCENHGVWVRVLGAKAGATTVTEATFANLDHPVMVLGSDMLEITVDPRQGGQVLEIYDKRSRTNQLAVDYDKLGGLARIPFAYCLWSAVDVLDIVGREPPWPRFRRGSVFAVTAKEGGLVLSAESGGIRLTESMTLSGGRFSWSIEAKNETSGTAKMRWHVHPEYTIAGTADSYQDYLLLPTEAGENKLVFWSGLGERRLESIAAGWWRMIDPKAGYEIRQDFRKDDFQVPKLWFGIGAFNVEMLTKIVDVAPGASLKAALDWTLRREDSGRKSNRPGPVTDE